MNDIINRCTWCGNDPLYVAYHDNEWSKPIFDDRALFALLCLESMQAGLSWITILRKRENYYHAFADFDPNIIATFDDKKVDELMQNAGIIRHWGKIKAIIDNAKLYLQITQTQSFSDYLWAMSPNGLTKIPQDNKPKSLSDIPSSTEYSTKMAKQLKKDGFKFLGATTCYAFMQACGMVNDHLVDCEFRN
ncbi:MAG: DNA-3-methyladenine glycosylase I [Moraxella sp.]|uniref:DNA-3-methyladenine glycosylase I n=1 Tax=Moraxella sp. TaxID=479 RepID=UPI0026DCB07E|nr:DNA-3-methyladenine glycosylase I [Moraxella sp.]MDO4449364.1 DNA-3-methyladenine glycosylase I [Moraxella sp.]